MSNGIEAGCTLCSTIVEHTHAHIRPQKSIWRSYLDQRDCFLVLSSSQSNFAKALVLLLAQCWNHSNGLRTSQPCWWTKTKDLSLASFVHPPAIVHYLIVICVSRDWLQTINRRTYSRDGSSAREGLGRRVRLTIHLHAD